jgi:Ca2+ transporting ATPase
MQGTQFRAFVEGVIKDGEGKEIIKNMDNFKKVEQQLRVLARSSPEDKYIMATGLKQL